MEFVIAKTFSDSVRALSVTDTGRTFVCLDKIAQNPTSPGLKLKPLENADPAIRSARASKELRVILSQLGDRLVALYVGHHDDAIKWATTHQVEQHPRTGALQIVPTVDVSEAVPAAPAAPVTLPAKPGVFEHLTPDNLLDIGVPESWVPKVRACHDEDAFLAIMDSLPEECQGILSKIVDGIPVDLPTVARPKPTDDPFDHPDTKHRFTVIRSAKELEPFLKADWATWMAFLHPDQQKIVDKTYAGPLKVTGSAGTGKTVVAMHRARRLARKLIEEGSSDRVLLTTYSRTLAENLAHQISVLCTEDEAAKIDVQTVHATAMAVLTRTGRHVTPMDDTAIESMLADCVATAAPGAEGRLATLPRSFYRDELVNVILSQGVRTFDEYKTANRKGRGTALTARERKAIWPVFEAFRARQAELDLITWTDVLAEAHRTIEAGAATHPYRYLVVDEVQDLEPAGLRFVGLLAGQGDDRLTLVGDGGQRIHNVAFSMKDAGIDVRGRSLTLRVNYRTTQEIRAFADRILGDGADDMDGGTENRRGTISLIYGEEPVIEAYDKGQDEARAIAERIKTLIADNVEPSSIAIFARKHTHLEHRYAKALEKAAIPYTFLEDQHAAPGAAVRLGTFHRAKGLEFRIVFIGAVEQGVVPAPAEDHDLPDEAARQDHEARERSLLYVAMTRAREELRISYAGDKSQWLGA